ncbi:NAD(P)H-hydrate dehydratase [Mesorhizobium sp. BAC0120]|uniref:NAD(P)H-hydrate dehydratase n=1 Tax=Mesorhizobium sp. BAC0120 TaxID=3090670 RepID=UPI00298CC1C1|nr:NAD(P)H-hydrate dehydratase [Mesorhizobium sp. BAC0120]MDW6023117.1 NAD(P)H-hydrate dehydratase [Mesorhizobium sp. BAC0120]
MPFEILTPTEMGDADRLTIASGLIDGIGLMRRAGDAVASLVLERFPEAPGVAVLAGPGNNGGDGYVVAERLRRAGIAVTLWRADEPRSGTDAAIAAEECNVAPEPLPEFAPQTGWVIVDALFGAGLARPVEGIYAEAIGKVERAGARVVAIDLPSGVSGLTGEVLGIAPRAELTVTFFCKKPGHLLYPGRALCGVTVIADIGIRDDVLAAIEPKTVENDPANWIAHFPAPGTETHKYARGHVAVFCGGLSATGAARLSAMAAARTGSGAVTLLSPASALAVNAAHLTSIILRKSDSIEEAGEFLQARKPGALVLGPGFGTNDKASAFALELISAASGYVCAIVFDADALTIFSKKRSEFIEKANTSSAPALVLTPHEGEFGRLFPELAQNGRLSKLDRATQAAAMANSVIIYKGPDTVIAAPDGRVAINSNGTPLLATAGSGDVLSGVCAGLLAQGMPAFEAACAGVWMHAEAARTFGPGLIAEDLPLALAPVLRELGAKFVLR